LKEILIVLRKPGAVFHPGIGAPFCAGMMEEVIALGGEKFIACSGAGVLGLKIYQVFFVCLHKDLLWDFPYV
jgi:hypothetical protein